MFLKLLKYIISFSITEMKTIQKNDRTKKSL